MSKPMAETSVYCYCGERGEHECDPAKCVDADCWVGATMVGWPHDQSLCEGEGPTGCMDDGDELSQALRGMSHNDLDRILRKELG